MTTATGAVLPAGVLTCLTGVALPAVFLPATGFTVFTGLLIGLTTGFTADLTGTVTFFAVCLATGFTATFLTAVTLPLACLPETVFDTGFFTAAFLTANFLPVDLPATVAFFGCGLVTAFLPTGFGTGFLTTGFLATGFLTRAFFTATFFTATFFTATLAAGLAAARVAFAGVLVALFTGRPLLTAAFDLPVLTTCAAAEVLPFCALAAVELRVVFAISLHRLLAVAAGCYSPTILYQQARDAILLEY